MLERILPPEVEVAEAYDDPADVTLFAEEEAYIARSVDKRRREFTTVRHCARTALARLGLPAVPIAPGERGAPRWPAGVVGSMTHCAGYRAAAIALARDVLTVGVDAEPHEPLPDGVFEAIALDTERDRTERYAAGRPDVCWDRLLFSAKESVYKAWFPLTGRFLDFTEAEMVIDPGTGTFRARLLVPAPVVAGQRLDGFTGRYTVRNGLVLSAISVPAGTGGRAAADAGSSATAVDGSSATAASGGPADVAS